MKPPIVALALVVAGCWMTACSGGSSSSPAAPSAPASAPAANIVMGANPSFSLPGCTAIAALGLQIGVQTTTCPKFTGSLINTGAGCATNVHGTTTTRTNGGQQVGLASWTYGAMVRPNETIAYSGGSLDVPSSLSFQYQTVATWTDVRCN